MSSSIGQNPTFFVINLWWNIVMDDWILDEKLLRGASTVKWTTLDPCSTLGESDPKLYTNFEFYEIEIHEHLENLWIYKAKQFKFTIFFSNNVNLF